MRDVNQLIERRRLELALSRRDLADRVGCRIGAVQALENGGDLSNWPLRMVRALISALGLTWADLEEADRTGPAATAVERLGAELVRTGRLRDVDMRGTGAHDALPALRQRLQQVGMTLAETAEGHHELVAREDVPGLLRVFEDISDRLEAGDLTGPEEDVVTAIANRSLDRQRLSASRSRAVASLLRAGLVEEQQGVLTAAGPLASALGAVVSPDEST
jgi:transcriptional regulator with XRE-family HTH domain